MLIIKNYSSGTRPHKNPPLSAVMGSDIVPTKHHKNRPDGARCSGELVSPCFIHEHAGSASWENPCSLFQHIKVLCLNYNQAQVAALTHCIKKQQRLTDPSQFGDWSTGPHLENRNTPKESSDRRDNRSALIRLMEIKYEKNIRRAPFWREWVGFEEGLKREKVCTAEMYCCQ